MWARRLSDCSLVCLVSAASTESQTGRHLSCSWGSAAAATVICALPPFSPIYLETGEPQVIVTQVARPDALVVCLTAAGN